MMRKNKTELLLTILNFIYDGSWNKRSHDNLRKKSLDPRLREDDIEGQGRHRENENDIENTGKQRGLLDVEGY